MSLSVMSLISAMTSTLENWCAGACSSRTGRSEPTGGPRVRPLQNPYAFFPFDAIGDALQPGLLPGSASVDSNFQPRPSNQRSYIRDSICAQSCAFRPSSARLDAEDGVPMVMGPCQEDLQFEPIDLPVQLLNSASASFCTASALPAVRLLPDPTGTLRVIRPRSNPTRVSTFMGSADWPLQSPSFRRLLICPKGVGAICASNSAIRRCAPGRSTNLRNWLKAWTSGRPDWPGGFEHRARKGRRQIPSDARGKLGATRSHPGKAALHVPGDPSPPFSRRPLFLAPGTAFAIQKQNAATGLEHQMRSPLVTYVGPVTANSPTSPGRPGSRTGAARPMHRAISQKTTEESFRSNRVARRNDPAAFAFPSP